MDVSCTQIEDEFPLNSVLTVYLSPEDGNCLLHSAGTAVWGVSDKDLQLRRLLNLALSQDRHKRLFNRWRVQRDAQLYQHIDRLLEGSTSQVNH